jgi:hypothetical protein
MSDNVSGTISHVSRLDPNEFVHEFSFVFRSNHCAIAPAPIEVLDERSRPFVAGDYIKFVELKKYKIGLARADKFLTRADYPADEFVAIAASLSRHLHL